MKIIACYIIFVFYFETMASEISTPVLNPANTLELTEIGQFGLWREDRAQVPGHFHTGIDIKRPNNNYDNEPIFPMAKGIVISKRSDGPFAQIIVEHKLKEKTIWTVYEHIAGVLVSVNDSVETGSPIARFMNKDELDKYGWQFDHFHFEILKVAPLKLNGDSRNPQRLFQSYSLICYTKEQLHHYFYDPVEFLNQRLQKIIVRTVSQE